MARAECSLISGDAILAIDMGEADKCTRLYIHKQEKSDFIDITLVMPKNKVAPRFILLWADARMMLPHEPGR